MKATIIRPGAPPEHLDLLTRDRGLGPFIGRWRIVGLELCHSIRSVGAR